jgi:hypothetical protein
VATSRSRPWFDAAFLLLSPVVAWAALGIKLFNQNGYVDPWYYTGYGQIFPTLVETHGWPYYAVRFPVVFLISLFCSGGSPILGYGLLRYSLILLAGIPLYLLAKRHFGRPAAVCSFLFLFCNPLLPRVLLWDLTPFVSVPAALSGIAVWLLADENRHAGRFLAGALFAVSVSAHIFTITAIGCFLAVELAFALRKPRDLDGFARDLVWAALGGVVAVALGTLYYVARVGEFNPLRLVTANLASLGAGRAYAASHTLPFLSWAAICTYVYVPLILLGGLAALRGVGPSSGIERRIHWFLVAYCAFYLAYRFVLGQFVLEEFYYFGHLTIVVFLAVPLFVGRLARRGGRAAAVGGAFALGLVLPMLALRIAFEDLTRFLDGAHGSLPVISIFLAAVALLFVFLASPRFPAGAAWVAAFLVAVSVQFATLVHTPHRTVFDRQTAAVERGAYRIGVEYARFVGAYEGRDHRVLTWLSDKSALISIPFSVLGDSLNVPWSGSPGMPTIGRRERRRLAEPHVRYLMLLATKGEAIAEGKAALGAIGVPFRVIERRRLGDSGCSAVAELVEIARSGS